VQSQCGLAYRLAYGLAACITYELPGSLLKHIYDDGVSAQSPQRVALPTVSKLAATAELHYRLSGVGMFCAKDATQDVYTSKRNRGGGLTGICCVWYVVSAHQRALDTCHQRRCGST
jgi:hypothetical protein